MASNNPGTPENYYEEQFGDRIRNIAKGGGSTAPPPRYVSEPSNGPGSRNGLGRGLGGASILIFVVLGLLRAVTSSSHRHSPPPPPPRPIVVPQVQLPPNVDQLHNQEEINRILQQLREKQQRPIIVEEKPIPWKQEQPRQAPR
jgi:hypothetical protein